MEDHAEADLAAVASVEARAAADLAAVALAADTEADFTVAFTEDLDPADLIITFSFFSVADFSKL